MGFFRDIKHIAGALGHIATSLNGIRGILREINAGRIETLLGNPIPVRVEKVAETGGEMPRRKGGRHKTDGVMTASYLRSHYGLSQKESTAIAKKAGIENIGTRNNPIYRDADAIRIVAVANKGLFSKDE